MLVFPKNAEKNASTIEKGLVEWVFSNLNSSRTSRVKRANDELKIPYTYIEKFSLILFFVEQFLSSLSEHHIFLCSLKN